ncbi:MAG: hypothetical protein FWF70_06815 [Bacteroidetes bacterium]|nr:hypothetical protein [Bacteroidota bacterium]MCL1968710.1 hypothetical protein [Bacteroidota bacterium]
MEDKTLTLLRNKPIKIQEGSKWYVKFYVLVSSNDQNTYLASTYLPVAYDTTIFGTLPLNKITVTIDNNFNVAEFLLK